MGKDKSLQTGMLMRLMAGLAKCQKRTSTSNSYHLRFANVIFAYSSTVNTVFFALATNQKKGTPVVSPECP